RPPSSRTHRSMDGQPFIFQTPATLNCREEMEEEGFSYHAGLGARGTLSLIGLSRRLATHHGHWVDNTSLQGAANKGGSQSHAMTWEPQRIYEFFDSRGVQASVAYVRSAERQPRRRHITRSCFCTSGRGEG
ncbi:protein kinase, partial [Trypanosoma cruzi]